MIKASEPLRSSEAFYLGNNMELDPRPISFSSREKVTISARFGVGNVAFSHPTWHKLRLCSA